MISNFLGIIVLEQSDYQDPINHIDFKKIIFVNH